MVTVGMVLPLDPDVVAIANRGDTAVPLPLGTTARLTSSSTKAQ